MKSPLVVLLIAGMLAACNDPASIPPDDAEVRLTRAIALPGEELLLQSAGFSSAMPVVLVGADTLSLTRVDDSTVAAAFPDSVGVYALTVHLAGGLRFGQIRVAGFQRVRTLLPLTGWPLHLEPGSPIAIGSGPAGLVQINLGTGHAAPLNIPHTADCLISPGPSYQPGFVTSNNGCTTAARWQLGSSAPTDSTPSATCCYRLWAKVSSDTWFWAAHHRVGLAREGPGNPSLLEVPAEEVERVVFSPDRSLLALPNRQTSLGIPVLEIAAATIRYRLPLRSSSAIAFSPDGDTLFASGNEIGTGRSLIVAMDASTGAVLHSAPALDRFYWGLLADSASPYLIGLHLGPWRPRIFLHDRTTLETVRIIDAPASVACIIGGCLQGTIAFNASAKRIYVLISPWWGSLSSNAPDSQIFEFDLPPDHQRPVVLDR